MNNKIFLTTSIWVEEEYIDTLLIFNILFKDTNNFIKIIGKNDVNQIFVSFNFATPEAVLWLYKWIHKFKLDGHINKNRDNEIEWITGSPDFIKIVYLLLYKSEYQDNAINISEISIK